MTQAKLWSSLFLTLLACLSSTAGGQYATPPPRQELPQGNASQPAPSTAAAPRANVLRAVACLVGRDPAAGEALLAIAPYSPEERERAIRVLRGAERCLRQTSPIATSALLLRGAVAEVLYETRFVQPATPRSPVAAAAPLVLASDIQGREDAAFLSTSFDVAQCATPAHPDQIRSLLATEPASDSEMTALQALYPAFAACVPAGTQLRVDRGGIRAMLAETLYRWSVVQRDGSASPWAAPAPAQ